MSAAIDHLPAHLLGGRYRLGDLLGVGGSASVFVAEDLRGAGSSAAGLPGADRFGEDGSDPGASSTRVALKVLHPHLSTDDRARDGFFREARAAQPLHHENVAAVLDMGLHDGGGVTMAWIAFELALGESLAERVDESGARSVLESLVIVDGVLRALAAAHALGIVHRDVSPSNVIIVEYQGDEEVAPQQVRLVDFGLADAAGRPTLGTDILRAGEPTEDAGVIGNVQYMSPEQANGAAVDERGDLYQTGALLYFLLTGRPPYPRSTAREVMRAHISAPPPVPSAHIPGVPRPIDRIVTTAMSKRPEDRFANAAEFSTAVGRALASARRTSTRPAHAVGITGALGAAGAFGAAEAPRDAVSTGDVAAIGAAAGTSLTVVLPQNDRSDRIRAGSVPLDREDPAVLDPPPSEAKQAGVAALVIVVIVAVIGALLWGLSTRATIAADTDAAPSVADEIPSAPPSPSVSAPPSPSAEPSIPAAPTTVSVPSFPGALDEAQLAVQQAGLTVGRIIRVDSASPADTVLSAAPSTGTAVEPGTAVDLTVASGANLVPFVSGLAPGTAAAMLESAGFRVAERVSVDPSATSTTVTGTEPGSGAVMRLGVTITMLVTEPLLAEPSPTPSEPVDPPVDEEDG